MSLLRHSLTEKNVLYITLEMAEEKIAERIDANLLNVPIQEIADLPKMMYESKVTKLSEKTQGTLIIKEYPTASAHAGHFRGLLNELAIKKSFRPDIIFIDYLNICASSRYRGKPFLSIHIAISKLLLKNLEDSLSKRTYLSYLPPRLPVLVMVASDVELTDTSESFGLPATADFMFALISTDELEELGQIMVKQLKNRYNDPTVYKRFMLVLIVQKCVFMIANKLLRLIWLTVDKMRSILTMTNLKNHLMVSNSNVFCI